MKNAFLTGTSIYLSPLTEEDVTPQYISWLNDKDVCRENSHATFPNTRERTIDYVRSVTGSKSEVVLGIRWKKNDRHVGNISLQKINWVSRSAELAIILGDKGYWNKGIGTEAYSLMIDYAFSTLNLNRVSSAQTVRNKGMIAVCEKCGMKREGILRQILYKEGEYADAVIYSILRAEYEKLKSKKK